MLTSEVLNRAADLIEERGWTTGCGWFPKPGEATPVCAEGAIKLASTDEFGLRLSFRDKAYDALVAYLNDRFPECTNSIRGSVIPFSWNDRPDRTASEVIEVLRAAAAIEQAREAEATPAPRSVLTSPALLEQAADRHGVPVVVVDGYYSAILYRPSGEAILWRAVVPESERVALGLAVA